MNLPKWILEEIIKFEPPKTGKVMLEMECWQGTITKIEIGGITRIKSENEFLSVRERMKGETKMGMINEQFGKSHEAPNPASVGKEVSGDESISKVSPVHRDRRNSS